MSRGQFAVMTLMVSLAVFAGVIVGALVPPVGRVEAQELRLEPAPPTGQAIETPSFADLAERTLPSVVRITSVSYMDAGQDPLEDSPWFRRFHRGDPFGSDEDDERRMPLSSGGSGFIITTDGYILTNKHVIEDAEHLTVQTQDGREWENVRIVGSDPYLDLAMVKIDAEDLPALPLGDSSSLRVGEWVMAIGHPIRFDYSVTVGVVSGKGRGLSANPEDLGRYIQTDAAINLGNSGGPLLNTRGEVVGISTAIVRGTISNGGRSGSIEGMGFALPISAVRPVLQDLVQTGTVKRGWLGVTVRALTQAAAEYHDIDPDGALVARVDPASPAEKAGLRKEDIIVAVDGQAVRDNGELVSAISNRRPGDDIQLSVLRPEGRSGVQKIEFDVTLGERRVGLEEGSPVREPRQTSERETALGFTVGPVPYAMRESLAEEGVEGVMVVDVDPASSAYREALRRGVIITSVNGEPTPTVEAYREAVEAIEPGEVVRLTVHTSDGMQNLLYFRAPEER
jgi:serine protease Do